MNSEDQSRLDDLARRLTALERTVQELAEGKPRSEPAIPPTPLSVPVAPPLAAPAETPAPNVTGAPGRNWEELIGRYGMLVLAGVAALAAVGTFIGWAITKGWLGPTQRVVLGLLLAGALAITGFWLRRTERSFGSSLLGIALAVVHACAWGAGPSLHLVPDGVVFAMASLASALLALLAHKEEDEPLWCVGFAGATVAPFVTSSGAGSMPLLAAYAALVLTASGYALGARPWRIAGRLFSLSATVYVGALMLGTERNLGPLYALAVPLVVAFVGVLPWSGPALRRHRLRLLGTLTALAALRVAFTASGFPLMQASVVTSLVASGVAWLIVLDLATVVLQVDEAPGRMERDWVDAGLVPVALLLSVYLAMEASTRTSGMMFAAATVLLFIAVARHGAGALRDAAVVATMVAAVSAAAMLASGRPLLQTGAVAGVALAGLAASRWRASAAWTAVAMPVLGYAMLATVGELNTREVYRYVPFGTRESALGAWVAAALFASWRVETDGKARRVLLGGAVTWTFVWVHQEIAFAWNATAATLLRVSYYAATSVASVWVGRARGVPVLRHAGLGLGIVAAGTALYSARHLTSIGARIFADLVAAAFLLAIAYWYRKPGSAAAGLREPRSLP